MQQISMWWGFLFLFALFIGGIQALGWWTRTASVQTPIVRRETQSAERSQVCETMHWRSLVMHQ